MDIAEYACDGRHRRVSKTVGPITRIDDDTPEGSPLAKRVVPGPEEFDYVYLENELLVQEVTT